MTNVNHDLAATAAAGIYRCFIDHEGDNPVNDTTNTPDQVDEIDALSDRLRNLGLSDDDIAGLKAKRQAVLEERRRNDRKNQTFGKLAGLAVHGFLAAVEAECLRWRAEVCPKGSHTPEFKLTPEFDEVINKAAAVLYHELAGPHGYDHEAFELLVDELVYDPTWVAPAGEESENVEVAIGHKDAVAVGAVEAKKDKVRRTKAGTYRRSAMCEKVAGKHGSFDRAYDLKKPVVVTQSDDKASRRSAWAHNRRLSTRTLLVAGLIEEGVYRKLHDAFRRKVTAMTLAKMGRLKLVVLGLNDREVTQLRVALSALGAKVPVD